MLPPFYITTEVHATRRNYGHYMTNFGASLSSIMFGMTGLQFGQMGSDPTGWGGTRLCPSLPRFLAFLSSARPGWLRDANGGGVGAGARVGTLPLGWERITFEAWLGGQRYRVVGEHGACSTTVCVHVASKLSERSFASHQNATNCQLNQLSPVRTDSPHVENSGNKAAVLGV